MADQVEIDLVEPVSKRLQRRFLDAKYSLLGLTSRWQISREARRDLGHLRVFCCFVGHGRSGGSLVGALLNAHPNIVMSNELNALRRLSTGMTAQQLFRVIYLVSKRQVARGSKGGGGYTYAVPNQWQGRHRELLVIGDRKAGATAYEIRKNPEVLNILDRNIWLDKKFIHVVRNPFNTITTTYRKTLPQPGQTAEAHLSREIRNYFSRCSAVRSIELRFGDKAIHYIHQERLIADPIRQLADLCNFLGVEAYPDYLSDCADILMKSPHETRHSVEWSEQQIAAVKQRMKEFRWLSSYEHHS